MFGFNWQVLDEYQKTFGDSWKIKNTDSTDAWPYLPEALAKYQVCFQAEL
jgi:synaptobrevin family protein YKT6